MGKASQLVSPPPLNSQAAAEQLTDLLCAAVHRDLKSPNLLLSRFPSMEGEQETFAPVVKITDFGLPREKVTKVQEDLRESLAIARASL